MLPRLRPVPVPLALSGGPILGTLPQLEAALFAGQGVPETRRAESDKITPAEAGSLSDRRTKNRPTAKCWCVSTSQELPVVEAQAEDFMGGSENI